MSIDFIVLVGATSAMPIAFIALGLAMRRRDGYHSEESKAFVASGAIALLVCALVTLGVSS